MPYKDPDRQREYQRRWMRKRREEFFADKECLECGGIDNLELHHRDPNIKITHKIWSWAENRRKEELKKCDILCTKCHKEKTAKQRSVDWEHGTPYGYRTHGCRCDACREAHRLYMREYLDSRKNYHEKSNENK